MTSLELVTTFCRRSGIMLALCLGFAGANPAAASILYDFSLPSNGSVGAVDIQLTFPSFVPAGGGLSVYNLAAAPVTSFSSVTPVNAAASVIGFEVDAGSTIVGLHLVAPDSSIVLFNVAYPADFFAFTRTANETGTFTGLGTVTSALTLDTSQPTATLVVTDTSAVPEPGTAGLLGLCLFAITGLHLQRRSA